MAPIKTRPMISVAKAIPNGSPKNVILYSNGRGVACQDWLAFRQAEWSGQLGDE